MTEEQQKNSIRDAVMEKIKTGEEPMLPKWHFALMSALYITGIAIGVLILLFIVSFIFFTLDNGGSWFLPAFGLRGLRTFFSSLPWLLILFGGILIILLEVLARRFSFVYRRPHLYFLMALILLIASSSLIISQTPLHQNFNDLAAKQRLPLVGGLYRNFSQRENGDVHLGAIDEFTDDGFFMDDRQNNTFRVIVTEETVLPSGADFEVGEWVIVLGKEIDQTIKALGVNIIDACSKLIPMQNCN